MCRVLVTVKYVVEAWKTFDDQQLELRKSLACTWFVAVFLFLSIFFGGRFCFDCFQSIIVASVSSCYVLILFVSGAWIWGSNIRRTRLELVVP